MAAGAEESQFKFIVAGSKTFKSPQPICSHAFALCLGLWLNDLEGT